MFLRLHPGSRPGRTTRGPGTVQAALQDQGVFTGCDCQDLRVGRPDAGDGRACGRLFGRASCRPSARSPDRQKTRRVGMGDLAEPLYLRGHDELSELAVALNAMCEQLTEARARVRAETEARIEALEQLRRADRLKTVGRPASGVAHELGTPLNVVSGRATMVIGGKLRRRDRGQCHDHQAAGRPG